MSSAVFEAENVKFSRITVSVHCTVDIDIEDTSNPCIKTSIRAQGSFAGTIELQRIPFSLRYCYQSAETTFDLETNGAENVEPPEQALDDFAFIVGHACCGGRPILGCGQSGVGVSFLPKNSTLSVENNGLVVIGSDLMHAFRSTQSSGNYNVTYTETGDRGPGEACDGVDAPDDLEQTVAVDFGYDVRMDKIGADQRLFIVSMAAVQKDENAAWVFSPAFNAIRIFSTPPIPVNPDTLAGIEAARLTETSFTEEPPQSTETLTVNSWVRRYTASLQVS